MLLLLLLFDDVGDMERGERTCGEMGEMGSEAEADGDVRGDMEKTSELGW